MKIKRHKQVHKNINFYTNYFGFRQPFQILIDGTFCHAALKNKINIQDQLPKYLQVELKLLTTQCIVLETEELGSKVFGCMKIVKQFPIHKCGHEKSRISGSECLKSMVKNKNEKRYIIATQDRELQKSLREVPGIPILYLHQSAPILEKPSTASKKIVEFNTNNLFEVNKTQEEILSKLKVQSGIIENKNKEKRKRKKKQPNPLSCLKSKKKNSNDKGRVVKKNSSELKNKIKRKRIKIPKHVKKELIKTVQTS